MAQGTRQMKIVFYSGILTALQFPILWSMINGRESLRALYTNDPYFTLSFCTLAGLDGAGALWFVGYLSRFVPPKLEHIITRFGSASLAGILLAMQGHILLTLNGVESFSLLGWLVIAEGPEFLAAYIANWVVFLLIGLLAPTKSTPPRSRRQV